MGITRAILRFAFFFFMDILVMVTLSEIFPDENLSEFWANPAIAMITIATGLFYAIKDWEK